jgi:hypothetical protein
MLALGAMAKGIGSLGKKTKKVDTKKFAGKKDGKEPKPDAEPKGELVPSPGGAIIKKIVDVKIDPPEEIKTDPKDPVGGVLVVIRKSTIDAEKALKNEQKAHKKKFKKDQKKAQKKKRIARESWLEGASKKIGAATGAIASKTGITSLWDTIIQLISVTFLGWLTRYLPQILGFAKFVIEWVGKIGSFIAMLVTPVIKGVMWIAGAGAKLVSMLLGTDPEEAAQKNLLGNLADIQKKVPLMEAAFAAFMVFGGIGKIKKLRKPGEVKPKSKKKLSKADRRNAAKKRLRNRKANKNLKKVKDFGRKKATQIKGAVAKKSGKIGKVASKVGSKIGKVAGKVGKLGGKLMKGMKFLGKFAKIPIIGPLIVAVTQILAGEPIAKALFMGLGAALGGGLGTVLAGALTATGIGSVLAPIAMILGEGIGMFVGELLYEAMLGKGPGAAMKRLGEVVGGIFKGIGNVGKAIMKFIFGGGIWKFLGNILGGMGKLIGWLFSPKGLLGLLGKVGGMGLKILKFLLIDMIPMAIRGIGNAGKAVLDWIGAGIGRMITNFPMVEFPQEGIGDMVSGFVEKIPLIGGIIDWEVPDWVGIPKPLKGQSIRKILGKLPSIPDALGWIFSKIPGLDRFVKDGQVKGMPAIWQLFNPLFMPKFAMQSFFPPKGGGDSISSQISSGGDGPTKDTKDKEIKGKGSEEKSKTASSISSSASYDKKGGGRGGMAPVNTKQMQKGAGDAGGSGGGTTIEALNKYELVSTYSKAMMLAKLYKD